MKARAGLMRRCVSTVAEMDERDGNRSADGVAWISL